MIRSTRLLPLALVALATPKGLAQIGQELPVITVDGEPFYSWADYTSSETFRENGLRCTMETGDMPVFRAASDCEFFSTNPIPQYDPVDLIQIPVVVHVIQSTTGAGAISDSLVQSQIDILNEDFRAMAGTNGANGTDTMIQFFLAQVDPNGNPTNGITRSTNNTWFNDGGSYWNTLAWDTNRYLNIYTNSASGALGYVPGLPQNGIVGSAADRVVVLWSSFGRNAPIGSPFNLGRTTTHEVGHYFGLWHTFDNGCGSTSACYTSGDTICDTNPESSPTFGCPGARTSCSLPAPFDNYMDYSDDICMEMFTPEQTNRMRCTILEWRSNLPCTPGSVATRLGGGANYDTAYTTTSQPLLGSILSAQIDVSLSPYNNAMILGYLAPDNLTLSGNRTLLFDVTSTRVLQILDNGPIAKWNLDLSGVTDPVFCGLTIYTQGYLFGGAPSFGLTNSQDWTLGL